MKNEGSHELDVTFSEVIECKKIVMGVALAKWLLEFLGIPRIFLGIPRNLFLGIPRNS